MEAYRENHGGISYPKEKIMEAYRENHEGISYPKEKIMKTYLIQDMREICGIMFEIVR